MRRIILGLLLIFPATTFALVCLDGEAQRCLVNPEYQSNTALEDFCSAIPDEKSCWQTGKECFWGCPALNGGGAGSCPSLSEYIQKLKDDCMFTTKSAAEASFAAQYPNCPCVSGISGNDYNNSVGAASLLETIFSYLGW